MRPVLILGVCERSGTNFLRDLMTLHPDIAPAAVRGEDFLLAEARHLDAYVEDVARHWAERWENRPERLRHLLGDALERFLAPEGPATAFVSKTPSTRGLASVHALFPRARIVLLVRDGRDVAESATRGFGWSYESAFRRWVDGARRVVDFRARHDGEEGTRWALVRFEDLVERPEDALPRLWALCGVDGARYDYARAVGLPVRGSSFRADVPGRVGWEPVPRADGFSPVGRWADWPASRHARYAWLCGETARALGYDAGSDGAGLVHRTGQRLRDVVWRLRSLRSGGVS